MIYIVSFAMSSQTPSSDKYDVSLGNLGARLDISRMENGANVAIVEHTLPGHTLAAPLHRHSREDEISYVLEGEMTVLADDELTTVPAEESVVKGRGGLAHVLERGRRAAPIPRDHRPG